MDLNNDKICITSSFGREVKMGVPCIIFKVFKRNFLRNEGTTEGKIENNFRSPAKFSTLLLNAAAAAPLRRPSADKSGKNIKPQNPTEARCITGNLNSFEWRPNRK
jgi:hypothetical protein